MSLGDMAETGHRTRLRDTHVVGILGWPLKHTLSPKIHNAAFRHMGLDWLYVSFPVPPESLQAAVAGIRVLGISGANVTMPHKEKVSEQLDRLSGDAREIGAVNTIQRFGDELIGHNTDIDGFREFLTADAGVEVKAKAALVLGAGGAARAVVKALSDLEAGEIVVAARRRDQSEELIGLSGVAARVDPWEVASLSARDADVVVNTTPLGMGGEDPVPEAQFRPGQVVVDLIYDHTPLIERARDAGADAWGGLGMLVHQAAASFRIWTGQDPPFETMSAAAVRGIGAHLRG